MNRIIVTTDLGYGDSGKGTMTDWFVFRQEAKWVVRTGAPQAFHRVATTSGRQFTFSQFGSGTFRGANTYLSRHMVVDPYALLAEGRTLVRGEGIRDAFERMYMSEDCLLITPWHAIANRIKELARGKNMRSTVGIGVGETICHSIAHPSEACRVRDIGKPILRQKFEHIRERITEELTPLYKLVTDFPEFSAQDIESMGNPKVIDWALDEFLQMRKLVRVVPDWFFQESVLQSQKPVVCEASQGLLLAPTIGWHPFTTKGNPTSLDIIQDIRDAGYGECIRRFGILRSYQTRHGRGPFVTEDAHWSSVLTDESNSSDHPWQGKFRVGPLDLVALRYAIACVGGPNAFDGLIVTCLDRMQEMSPWQVCLAYNCTQVHSDLFDLDHERISNIRVPQSNDNDFATSQTALGNALLTCTPVLTPVNDSTVLLSTIERELGVPVVVGSYGPTEKDKKVFVR